ncbi:MAG: RagB/SusD family nutrient uptake outer membrane protein [Gemmatimonadaceae bacterium]
MITRLQTHTGSTIQRLTDTARRSLALVALIPLAACELDSVLDVHVPGRVREEALADPALAPTMVASVIADLECAWNNYVAAAALMSDEFIQASGNLNQRNWGSRRITADDPNMATASCRAAYGIYTTLHTARFQAEDIFKRLDAFSDQQVASRTALKATVRAYGAYALVALGEGFCEMVIDGGSIMTPARVLEQAEARFTEAIALATAANNQDILNMALIGRARVRLDLKNYAGALADAQRIPTTYVKNATRDETDSRRYDALCEYIACAQGRHATVSPSYRGVTWQGVADPRVQVTTTGRLAFDNAQVWHYPAAKHQARGSAVVIGSFKEARLIVAEAAARANDLATARRLISDMHTAAGIPGYDPGNAATQSEVIRQVIEERRRELFTEGGHRFNDHLRLVGTEWVIPFKGEAGSAVHPSGVDATGLPYGTTKCFPLPTVERANNPNTSR